MIVDILLGISRIESVVGTGFVVKRHVLSRTQILRECLRHMEACIGIGFDLKTVHLATLGSNQDSTLGTLGAIEHNSLCTLEEGDLLYFRRKHIVRRTLHTVDDDERHVAVVVVVKTVIIHTPKVVAVPSANKRIHVLKATRHIILLLKLFHVHIGNTSEKMIGILVAESNMDFLFHHGGISVVSSLGIDRQRRYRKHGKEKYVSFNMFHKIVNFQLSIINCHCLTIPGSGGILHKDRCPCREAGTSSALIPNDG